MSYLEEDDPQEPTTTERIVQAVTSQWDFVLDIAPLCAIALALGTALTPYNAIGLIALVVHVYSLTRGKTWR